MFRKLLSGRAKAAPDLHDAVLRPVAPAPAATRGFKRIDLEYPIHPRSRSFRSSPAGERLVAKLAASVPGAEVLVQRIAGFEKQLLAIPREAARGTPEPSWVNDWFPGFDAAMLYGLLALRNPRLYVEVGSGNSTLFARRAIRDHGLRTRIISVDPCPRAEVDAICDQVVRAPLEDVDPSGVVQLSDEDLLFVDSSHRSFQNSDVTVFFTEILPQLPPGIVYGMHDIYLPDDYPPEWATRFYNEQYLLACYLARSASGGDEVLAPLYYLHHDTKVGSPLAPVFDHFRLTKAQRFGNAFWMRKAHQ